MKLSIDITDEMYQAVKNGTWYGNELWYNALKNGIPQETVTEFADRCRECGARYGRLLNQKWIPVSERLPEKSTWVLVTCKNPDGYIFLDIKLINRYTELWDGDEDFIGTVLAWMPLPEPYKKEGGEE